MEHRSMFVGMDVHKESIEASCGARRAGPLTGSWSKGRNLHYAYYHCQRQCRAVNVSKSKLEGLFVDELALLQPSPGYMRLVKDRVLHVWQQIRGDVKDRAAEVERRVRAIQQKLDRLDEAVIHAQTIDLTSYLFEVIGVVRPEFEGMRDPGRWTAMNSGYR